jgi:spore coat protein A
MKRRDFVKLTAMAGAATLVPWQRAYASFAQSPSLQKFVSPLRGLGQMAPAVAVTNGPAANAAWDYYEISARQFTDVLHPSLPATTLWGYSNTAQTSGYAHLGGAIVARRGKPVRLRMKNELPATHILPVDLTSPGVDPGTMSMHNRIAVHLHGGHVPWPSDGGPWHWFGPGDTGPALPVNVGASYHQWLPDTTGAMTADYWYPNDQSARLQWYHDHAVGITRLNAYAGLATAYLVTEPVEDILVGSGALPSQMLPLVFQDKVLDAARPGQLWYPSVYDEEFFLLTPPVGSPPVPNPSLVAEFWGDTMLVNGTVHPFVDVEPRRYRLRLLNACNTRFLSLQLVYSAGKKFPDSAEPNVHTPGPIMQLIGTEGGFLDPAVAPQGVPVGTAKNPLVLAPAERADIIVDFSKVKPGNFIILHNDAPVPFPGGTPLADSHPDNSKLAIPPLPGFSPNTRTLLQFRVIAPTGTLPVDPPVPAAWALPPLDPPVIAPWGTVPEGVYVRDLTLNEAFDEFGRLTQLIGTNALPPGALPGAFGLAYTDAPTEVIAAGATEVWRVFNLTADAHPLHFHLANAQIVSRQPFNVKQYAGVPNFTAAPMPPAPHEMGWKETVVMYPGECTTVVMKFDLPANPTIPVSTTAEVIDPVTGLPMTETTVTPTEADPGFSPRTGGREYVWHCHILEHEEHDMMRPIIIT